MGNYAFIDSQNVHNGIRSLGWKMDWAKFRVYLKEKYSITVAYVFIGFLPVNQDLYDELKRVGYVLVFKPVIFDKDGKPKGNCDADLKERLGILEMKRHRIRTKPYEVPIPVYVLSIYEVFLMSINAV